MARQIDIDRPVLGPPTAEERQRMIEVLNRLERQRAELLAARKGKLYPSAGRLVNQLRDERTRQLP